MIIFGSMLPDLPELHEIRRRQTGSPVEEEKRRLRWKFLYVGRDGKAAGHLPWDCTNALKLLVVAKAANSSWQQLGRETEQWRFQAMTTWGAEKEELCCCLVVRLSWWWRWLLEKVAKMGQFRVKIAECRGEGTRKGQGKRWLSRNKKRKEKNFT